MSKAKKTTKEPGVIAPPASARLLTFEKCSTFELANLAVHLLEGDDYGKAADRALHLLDACKRRLYANESDCHRMQVAVKKINAFREEHKITDGVDFVPYAKAAKIITGEVRPDRSKEKLSDFVQKHLMHEKGVEYTPEMLTERLKAYEEGMSIEAVIVHRDQYRAEKGAEEFRRLQKNSVSGKKPLGAAKKAEKRQIGGRNLPDTADERDNRHI